MATPGRGYGADARGLRGDRPCAWSADELCGGRSRGVRSLRTASRPPHLHAVGAAGPTDTGQPPPGRQRRIGGGRLGHGAAVGRRAPGRDGAGSGRTGDGGAGSRSADRGVGAAARMAERGSCFPHLAGAAAGFAAPVDRQRWRCGGAAARQSLGRSRRVVQRPARRSDSARPCIHRG